MADTGNLSFATAANVDDSTGSSWATPNNSKDDDGVNFTTCSLTDGGHSDYDKLTNPGSHGMPDGSTINGIQVDIKRKASLNGVDDQITDRHVYIVVGGTIQTTWTDLKAATVWPTTNTNKTYGGSSQLWGNPGTWAVSDFDSGFGVAISVNATATVANIASIDYISVKIYYTPAGYPAMRKSVTIRLFGHTGQNIF